VFTTIATFKFFIKINFYFFKSLFTTTIIYLYI